MQLTHIKATNIIGARAINVALTTPIVLFAGGNAAGKSSLAEAIRMALAGEVDRVSLKKEYGALVTDGAKSGEVAVTDADGDVYGMTLPNGKGSAVKEDLALPFVLNPSRFADLKPEERRAFLFSISGVSLNREIIKERLKERGADAALIEKVLPLLRSGFPAAAKFAADEARDAKTAWRTLTTETYGEKKAEEWEPELRPTNDDLLRELLEEIEAKEREQAKAQEKLGALQERQRLQQAQEKQRSLAAQIPTIKAKLATDEAELEAWRVRVEETQARAGHVREGLIHDLAKSLAHFLEDVEDAGEHGEVLARYVNQYGPLTLDVDPAAAAFLPKAIDAYELMSRAVSNGKRDLAAAQAAEAAIAQDPSIATDDDLAAALAEVQTLRTALQTLRKDVEALNEAVRFNAQAGQRKKDAIALHRTVQAWARIADSLSPNGIPAELLASALGPINERLAHNAQASGWMQVTIDSDMNITAAGRPYRLLSESERWRTDAMIGEAISQLSGWRLLLLDRVDVLQPSARGELLDWLDGLANAGEIDTALILATLKTKPTASALPDTMSAHWIENGELESLNLRRAA